MTRAHSVIGASSFKRTIECPGWVNEAAKLPASSNRTSSFAAEGTVAHYISELALQGKKDLSAQLGQTITIDGHPITVDEEMVDMADVYVGYIQTLESLGYTVWLEQRVSPNWLWSPGKPPVDLFGTCDCMAYHPAMQHLIIIDLKYGRGIAVEVTDNPQTLYYALGAFHKLAGLVNADVAYADVAYDGILTVTSVDTVIVQPRAPHKDGPIRRQTHATRDVIQWGMDVLMPAVERAALDPFAPFKAGDHCKFCPVAPTCPEIVKTAQDKARTAFAADDVDGGEQWADLLRTADVLEDWIAAVRTAAHERLDTGGEIPGFKLVPKRATRKWRDDAAVGEVCARHGLQAEHYLDAGVRSPAQVLGSRIVKANPELVAELNSLVTSISTGTTLAPADDPRPAVPARGAAKDVFSTAALDTE